MARTSVSGTPINLSASGVVSKAPGALLGYHVNSTSGGTIVVRDGTSASGTALNAAATPAIGYMPFPADCATGCFVTIAGTIDITFFFAAG